MCRLLLIYFLFLPFLVGPENAAGQSTELAQLQGVTLVVEDLDRRERTLGLNEDWLKNHALVLLQQKVPRLMVNQRSAEGSLLVDVTFGMIEREGKTIRYYGVLEVEAFRLVAIKKTEQIVWAPVWDGQYILTGQPQKATAQVKETLDLIIADFAAKWNRDNPVEKGKNIK